MSFSKKRTHEVPRGWEISMEDVKELIKQNQNLPRTKENKEDLVRQVADTLAFEAEKRIRDLFPSQSREARTSYIHFPSMESSLLTISMLLFGVYLSKVILKLLQSHYTRYNPNVGGFVMGGMRNPIMISKLRKERTVQTELKKIHLMHLIDKHNAQFN